MNNVYKETAAAQRYDAARNLPDETKKLWLTTLRSLIAGRPIQKILDAGCGTGRFTSALAETFGCPAVGVEPSPAMLEVAKSRNDPNVEWKLGAAEKLPLDDSSVDLAFMSQVFHHLPDPPAAFREIARVLSPGGSLAIRNSTREHNAELKWPQFFPEAAVMEDERTPSSEEIQATVIENHFRIIAHRTINQIFASSADEYFEKISGRGLSALIALSHSAFSEGLAQFRNWVDQQPANQPVYEPVDLFIFQKI